MPRIDPVKLLTCISSLLSPNGGIRSTAEVKRLASLMGKYSKKLVSKCIYIQILKCTETELLGQFMSFGGWALAHTWLTDGIESKNWPLVEELLELLLLCPVDVPRLQSNSAPKLVKSLSREEGNEGVRILATKLVEQWLKIARGEITSQSTNVVNKENLANRQSHLIGNTVTDSSLLDNCLSSEINGNDVTDSVIDRVIDERDEESLVFKISGKDGMKTVHKVTDSSPKKNREIVSADGVEKKHKYEKSSSKSKDSKDRERSKDKDKDRHHKKSSSSSSSHKTSSSSSSSSKHSSSGSSSKSHKSSSSSHKSSSSSSSSRDKDRHRSKSSSSSGKDRKEDKDKAKSDASKMQAEKDKDTLAKIQPQPLAKVKIPKKISEDTGKMTENGTTIPPKKKSISIEVRKDTENRPKTAKTYSTQFRNHGLGEEAPPPPSRRDLKKPSSVPTNGLAIPPTKRSLSPISMAKDADKKIKLAVTSPTVEKAGSIKLIPAKPKPPVLIESDMFMDAMTAATTKKEPRKRKRSLKDGETNGDKPTDAPKPVSSAPLRFYKDTQEDNNENKDDAKTGTTESSNTEDGDLKEKKSKNENENGDGIESATADSPDEPEEEEEVRKREPGPGCGPDGPPGVLTIHRRRGPKKSLRWKPQETLEEVRFFELDENERINVTKTFVDMKQMERTSEREAFLISRKIDSEDTMMEQMEWAPLILVDDVPDLPISTNSTEKDIQEEREKNVLRAIYFNIIPDSPHEPDCVIPYQNIQPQIIPLDDVTGNPDAVHDFTNMAWPEPRGSPPQQAGNNFGTEMGGLGAFGAFNQFGNNIANWQNPNPMIGLQPPPSMAFGGMIAGEGVAMNLNPLQQFNAANLANISPMMQQQMAVANNMGYMNNYAQPGPPMMNDNNRNNRGNNRFGANNNAGTSNWQAQGNNNNNQRQNWIKNRRICTGFQRGYCRHGDKCKYLHPGVNGPNF